MFAEFARRRKPTRDALREALRQRRGRHGPGSIRETRLQHSHARILRSVASRPAEQRRARKSRARSRSLAAKGPETFQRRTETRSRSEEEMILELSTWCFVVNTKHKVQSTKH